MKRAIVKGVLAGLAGTGAMTVAQRLEMSVTGRAPSTVPGQVTARLLGRSDTGAVASLNLPTHWAHGAAEEFGQNPGLCAYLEESRIPYVMAVPKTTLFTDAGGQVVQLDRLALQVRRNAWQRRACGIGSKGHRVYDWALIDSAERDHQYLIRRSIDDGELTYYHCHNPHHAGLTELVHVAGARWPIEECFGSSKNEVGLDNYQVRTWDAWHRHITLAMLAHTFLTITAHKTKKRGPTKPNN